MSIPITLIPFRSKLGSQLKSPQPASRRIRTPSSRRRSSKSVRKSDARATPEPGPETLSPSPQRLRGKDIAEGLLAGEAHRIWTEGKERGKPGQHSILRLPADDSRREHGYLRLRPDLQDGEHPAEVIRNDHTCQPPKPIIDKINAAIAAALADANVRKRYVDLGQEVPPPAQQSPMRSAPFTRPKSRSGGPS